MPIFVADEIVTAAKLNAATARDWTTWSPTLGSMTLGSGTVVARYVQIGKLVVATFAFTLGSGSAMGSGPNVTLPVTAASTVDTQTGLGRVRIFDSPGAAFLGTVTLTSTTVALFQYDNAAGTALAGATITSSVPMTWVSGDKLTAQWMYEAA